MIIDTYNGDDRMARVTCAFLASVSGACVTCIQRENDPTNCTNVFHVFFLDGYAIIMLETGDEKAVHYSLIVESPLVSFSYQTVTGGNISRA